MELIYYEDTAYPKFQTEGYASQFAIPFAKYFCKGVGYDIGCNRVEWSFPGAFPIDITIDDKFDAQNLPEESVDYIYSSHCLEHVPYWVDTLNYWSSKIKNGGTLFLYLPDYSQKYWRPWNNAKHVNIFTATILVDYMTKEYINIFSSGVDLNNSFMVVGEKK